MACSSCDPGESFSASYCENCERWTFHARKHHVFIAAGVMVAAVIVVALAVLQPELIAPVAAVGGGTLLKRAIA